MHVVEGAVDAAKGLAVGDELVHLQLTVHVVVHEVGKLGAALNAAESAALPHAAGDKLECCETVSTTFSGSHPGSGAELTASRDLLASSSDTDDDALAPALVAGLEGAAHDVHVAGAVEGVVETAVGHVHQPRLDRLALLQVLGRVHEVGATKLLCPLFLRVVHVNGDDLARTVLDRSLDDTETDAASTEDCNSSALLDAALAGGNDGRTVAGGDTAAEKAGAVHGCFVGDGDDGDIGHNGVLRESGAAHEVQKILALALEARGAVRHDTLALSRADGTAKVGLARLAELALLALGGAVEKRLLAFSSLFASKLPKAS